MSRFRLRGRAGVRLPDMPPTRDRTNYELDTRDIVEKLHKFVLGIDVCV